MQKRFPSHKPIAFAIIVTLCLLTGIDDISEYFQPLFIRGPIIESVRGHDASEDHSAKSVYNHPAWKDVIAAALQLCCSQVYEEINRQGNLIYISTFQNRSPPALS
jgi:hypothetical protein